MSHEPAETQATPAAPPDVIARQMGPDVTAWIADVLRQWSEAVGQVEELRRTADNNAAQVGTLASELTAARKRLTEVANHVDPSVLASVNAELAQSRKALADERLESEGWKQQAKNREDEVHAWVSKSTTANALRDQAFSERDAATRRAVRAESELTKTRQHCWEVERRTEAAADAELRRERDEARVTIAALNAKMAVIIREFANALEAVSSWKDIAEPDKRKLRQLLGGEAKNATNADNARLCEAIAKLTAERDEALARVAAFEREAEYQAREAFAATPSQTDPRVDALCRLMIKQVDGARHKGDSIEEWHRSEIAADLRTIGLSDAN